MQVNDDKLRMFNDNLRKRDSPDYEEIYTSEDEDNAAEIMHSIYMLSGIIIKEMDLNPLDLHKGELLKMSNQLKELKLVHKDSTLSEELLLGLEKNKITGQHNINIQKMFKELNDLSNQLGESEKKSVIQDVIASIYDKMVALNITPSLVSLNMPTNSIYSVPKDSILLQNSNNTYTDIKSRNFPHMVNNEVGNTPSSNLLAVCSNNITDAFNNTQALPASTHNASNIGLNRINAHKRNTPVSNQEVSKGTKFLYCVFEIYRFFLIPVSFFISIYSLSFQAGIFIRYVQDQQNINLYILQNHYVAMISAYFLISYFGTIVEIITYATFISDFCKNKCAKIMFGVLIEIIIFKFPIILVYYMGSKYIEHVNIVVISGLVVKGVMLILGIVDHMFASQSINSSFPRRDLFFNYIPRKNRQRLLLFFIYIIFFILMYFVDILFLFKVKIASTYNSKLLVVGSDLMHEIQMPINK
ncbi:hypothetical protein NEIRO03_1969 [Nematocida sp. AWRm78]|nr:hypothetical protein NEIRO03_1969 [Nematocida sp. AWRm78]